MDSILAAIRVALASYRAELQTITSEEETVNAYLSNLGKRREKLVREIATLEAQLSQKETPDGEVADD